MSVLVEGMNMPKSCFDCPISHPEYARTLTFDSPGYRCPPAIRVDSMMDQFKHELLNRMSREYE